MDKIYRLPARPEAKEANVVKGDKYRITVLTEGLLRLEYSEDGVFEDRATQTVLNRDFEPIPGLYATGNCSGRRFGVQYTTSLPGQSISIAQTLGREVGYYVAKM